MNSPILGPGHPSGEGNGIEVAAWTADQGDGTYLNPVLGYDYSDPDAIRVGEDFYLTASSFNCTPGLPILHSRDLVSWTLVNHAVDNLPHPSYAEVRHGCGVWAPSIRHHAGKFRIVFPMPDEGLYVTTADHPAGKWSEPHLLLGGKGFIDPCPFWDDDGQAYIAFAYAGSRAGIRNKLHIRPMTPDASRVTGPGKIVTQIDESLPALEGPKLHKRNGWYYISAPSGGVAGGWQVIFRSRSIHGPYEEKIVLAQRGTPINGPHQGALVDTPAGEWWFLHFQDADLYGRIVHLQPVRWEKDWPLIGVDQDGNGVGRPVLRHRKPDVGNPAPIDAPPPSGFFRGPRLGLQWQWHANHDPAWYSLSERPAHLRLYPSFVLAGDFKKAGNLLLQKFPAREFDVETALELPAGHSSLRAGLIVMGNEYTAMDLRRTNDGTRLRIITNGEAKAEHTIPGTAPVRLGVVVRSGGACRLGILDDEGGFFQVGPAFYARPGRWIGAKVGIYCLSANALDLSGHVDFSFFRVGDAPRLGRPLAPADAEPGGFKHPDSRTQIHPVKS